MENTPPYRFISGVKFALYRLHSVKIAADVVDGDSTWTVKVFPVSALTRYWQAVQQTIIKVTCIEFDQPAVVR